MTEEGPPDARVPMRELLSAFFSSTRVALRRLTKGVLLLLWIAFLGFMASLAWTGRVSDYIAGSFSNYVSIDDSVSGYYEARSPAALLDWYMFELGLFQDDVPPIGDILYEAKNDWTRLDFIQLASSGGEDGIGSAGATSPDISIDHRLVAEYWSLFNDVTRKLNALARSWDGRSEPVVISSVAFPTADPDETDISGEAKDVSLPDSAKAWLVREKARIQSELERVSLLDTFALLLVLGAFGSLIWLTNDYVKHEVTTRMSAYIFRPVLGMLLALAMFVVNLSLHGVLSDSPMESMRSETLYALAFAAGLLTEQAYGMVEKVTSERLRKRAAEMSETAAQLSQAADAVDELKEDTA